MVRPCPPPIESALCDRSNVLNMRIFMMRHEIREQKLLQFLRLQRTQSKDLSLVTICICIDISYQVQLAQSKSDRVESCLAEPVL